MIEILKQAEKMLKPLVAQAEAYKTQGGRKAGTILSKVRNAHLRIAEGIATIQSVTAEADALGNSDPAVLLREQAKPASSK